MFRFVSFEGADGCGKTTQWRLLHDWLRSRGEIVVATREPGGTRLAETLRHQLLHGGEMVVPRAETLLFGAARAQHVAQVIRPALERGEWVLCDRFVDSTLAYQGSGLGLDENFLHAMNHFAIETTRPTLTLLFDVPPAIARARRQARVQTPDDNIEARPAEFQERVRRAFLQIARGEPQRIVVIPAIAPPEEVQRMVLETLRERELIA